MRAMLAAVSLTIIAFVAWEEIQSRRVVKIFWRDRQQARGGA